jgi:radical SAM protein with 4Fe4S-binding SPASM domain
MVSAGPDGYLYPCSRLVGYEKFRIGTSKTGRICQGVLRDLMSFTPNRTNRCRTCEIARHCKGGCVSINFLQTGDIHTQSVQSCLLYKARTAVLLKDDPARLSLARDEPLTGACNVCVL